MRRLACAWFTPPSQRQRMKVTTTRCLIARRTILPRVNGWFTDDQLHRTLRNSTMMLRSSTFCLMRCRLRAESIQSKHRRCTRVLVVPSASPLVAVTHGEQKRRLVVDGRRPRTQAFAQLVRWCDNAPARANTGVVTRRQRHTQAHKHALTTQHTTRAPQTDRRWSAKNP